MEQKIRVLVIDEHALFREGLRLILEQEPDICVVGEAADGAEALAQLEAQAPDVVLLDLLMPEASGLETLGRLREKSPTTSVLVVTSAPEPTFMAAALAGGARGYLMKSVPPATLIKAIRAVRGGEIWAERRALTTVLDGLLKRVHGARRLPLEGQELLTAREDEILQWVVQGMRNREIGERLQISEKTVKTHLGSIFRKLNVNRRVELLLSRPAEFDASP
jgi:DNA-binding NarL/FixJ family response regulator